MAALLLRLGRAGSLKCFQRESWAAFQRTPAITFATNVEEPKKSGKKPKAAKGVDEQGSQLASKTLVAFPRKVVLPAVPPVEALGSSSTGQGSAATHQADYPSTSTASVIGETVTSESARLAKAETITSAGASEPGIVTKSTGTTITEPISKATLNEDGTSGSSSSSSDSDSDSESDDEKGEKAKPRADPTKKPEGGVSAPSDAVSGDEAHSPGPSQSIRSSTAADVSPDITPETSSEFPLTAASTVTSKAQSEEASAVPLSNVKVTEEKSSKSGVKEAIPSSPFEWETAASADEQTTAMSSKKLGDSVAVVATPKDPAAPGEGKRAAPEATLRSGKGAAPGEGKGAAPEAAPGEGKGAAPGEGKGAAPGEGKGAAPEAAPGEGKGAAPGEGKGAASPEGLVDPASVLSEAAGKEMKPEAETDALQSPDEVAPSPPEPEPFDNSTYKNLQHHSYHQYTFVDMEVEMEKHRLPQPSSGRPSPRH
nr:NADH dehydrogenase [ubiquinone] flavoprotein 3, mitochondrial isoform X1 [Paramormyrops kingsleyae]XP_023648717.1 NADH dehydrogenase [ubiquinone] flavoprotein 3, mitochondrial isoform X2 [Paramormyrops kingsleyae]